MMQDHVMIESLSWFHISQCSCMEFQEQQQNAFCNTWSIPSEQFFGDSTLTYGGTDWERTPHGNGQGNGSGPTLWNCISSPLFDIVHEQDFVMKIESPITKTKVHYTRFGYVDDTDLIQTIQPGQTNQQLLATTQKFLQLWEELLRCAGGALDVRDKSDWTFINFIWT